MKNKKIKKSTSIQMKPGPSDKTLKTYEIDESNVLSPKKNIVIKRKS